MAKESCLGGNNMTTNVNPDSFLSFGGTQLELPQPTVNVRIAYQITDTADTIFLGENLENYADDAAVRMKDADSARMSQVYLTFYTDKGCREEITQENLKKERLKQDTTYYAKAFLPVEEATDASNANSTLNGVIYKNETQVEAAHADGEAYAGKYDVKVKTGTLTITKKISKKDIRACEATQILEPQLLGLLCTRNPAGADAIGKFILIGDHKQLPAVVLQSSEQAEVCDEALQAIGLYNLKDSLFERLYRNLSRESANRQTSTSHPSSLIPHPSYDMLCRQGRMNIEVALFPNRAFYGGLLEPVGLPHQQGELTLAPELCDCEFAGLLTRRVAFLPSAVEPPAQSAKMNHSEARIVARLAAAIYRQYAAVSGFNPAVTLGVITPYRSQIALIKKEIAALGIAPLEDILVDTVERFQGSERDVIIYSFCVNRAYQLKFLANMTEENGTRIDRKLNVALTRARKQMFMTGVPQLLKLNPIYAELLSVVCHS